MRFVGRLRTKDVRRKPETVKTIERHMLIADASYGTRSPEPLHSLGQLLELATYVTLHPGPTAIGAATEVTRYAENCRYRSVTDQCAISDGGRVLPRHEAGFRRVLCRPTLSLTP